MSLADWFIDVDLDIQLDAVIYHSAPSSLSLASPSYENTILGICLKTECAKVKEGRVDFWYRSHIPNNITGGISFRMKTNAPIYDTSDCFVLLDGDDFWQIYWWDGLALTWLGEWETDGSPDVFRHLRVSWWEQAATLRVRLEYESGGVWNLLGADVNTGRNDNSGNAIQSVGLCIDCGHAGADKVWFDDVKIEKLVNPA
jgi:hypothetical protein